MRCKRSVFLCFFSAGALCCFHLLNGMGSLLGAWANEEAPKPRAILSFWHHLPLANMDQTVPFKGGDGLPGALSQFHVGWEVK